MTAHESGGGAIRERDAALDAAFDEVLAAERAAEEAVAACRAEAERCTAAAEAGAQRLAERAAGRLRQWREHHAAAVALTIADLQRQAATAGEPVALDDDARARLAMAVERLADELCGAGGEAR